MAKYDLTDQEVNTLLAALKFYQEKGQGDPANREAWIHYIATNLEKEVSMDSEGIDGLCNKLQYPPTNPDKIAIIWSTEDVLSVREDLTVEQAREVLQAAERRHDANEGINWIVLQCHADMMFPEDEENASTECRDCGSKFDGGVEAGTVCPACKRGMVTKQEA